VIGYLAGATERARIGTSVLVLPYRNPLLLAKTVASLDDLSGGRVTLGVGVGWMREEFAALGLPDEYFTRRGAVGDEWIEILRRLWTEENPSFEGRFHRFSNLGALPKPVQKPHPPILVGGSGPRTLQRVVEYGDGWMPIVGRAPIPLQEKITELNQMAAEAGRGPLEVTAFSARPEPEAITSYQAAGVVRCVFELPPKGADEVLPALDRLAALASGFG
jgi:probable F420-dependent oxidoreductase